MPGVRPVKLAEVVTMLLPAAIGELDAAEGEVQSDKSSNNPQQNVTVVSRPLGFIDPLICAVVPPTLVATVVVAAGAPAVVNDSIDPKTLLFASPPVPLLAMIR